MIDSELCNGGPDAAKLIVATPEPTQEYVTVYAIIEDSGRQFRVRPSDTINVDMRELPEGGDTLEFDRVLLIGDSTEKGPVRVGQPWLEGAKVVARVDRVMPGEKITVVKFRRRKGYRRKQGHRQNFLRVTIDKIVADHVSNSATAS